MVCHKARREPLAKQKFPGGLSMYNIKDLMLNELPA